MAVRDLNTQVVPGIHIEQGCIDSREDVIRAHIRILVDTDETVTDGDVEYPAPNETYVLPHILEKPEEPQRKVVPPAPPLEEDRDPFLDDEEDDANSDKDRGGHKRYSSSSPGSATNRRYPVRTSAQKKKKKTK